jgi:CHASE3 domain sensor protein
LGIEAQVLSRATRGYLLDPNPSSVENFNTAVQNIDALFPQLEELIRDQEQKQNLKNLETAIAELEKY